MFRCHRIDKLSNPATNHALLNNLIILVTNSDWQKDIRHEFLIIKCMIIHKFIQRKCKLAVIRDQTYLKKPV